MSSKGKLKRNFSDKDSKSDSEDEMGDFVLQRPKKKRICLDSGSESESSCLEQNILKNGEEPRVTSDDDDEPISNIIKKKAPKIEDRSKEMKHCSSDSSEDEPLANKHRKSSTNSNNESITKDVSSESEDELVTTSNKGQISQIATYTKLEAVYTSGSSSDDEPLAVKSKNCSSESKASGEIRPKDIPDDDDDDDDEPISNIIKKESSKIKYRSKEMKHCSSDSSEDEPLANKHRKSSTNSNNESITKDLSSESEDESEVSSDKDSSNEIIKSSKTNRKSKADSSANDSEEEFLTVKSKSSKQKPNGKKTKNKSVSDDLSSDDEEKSSNSSSKVLKEKVDKKKVIKDKNSSNSKIENLKKYLRVAGIRVQSYDKLFEDCKSIKSKREKLLGLLHEKGLQGQPTIEKCKKLKKMIETKKEIAELNLSNIIESEGRPKRGKIEKTQKTKKSPAGKKFMRLQDIIDSEESD